LSHFDRGTDAKVEEARTRASSESRRPTSIRRLIAGRTRRKIAFLSTALLLGATAVAVAGPSGEWLEGGQQATQGVEKFGPINPVNGFPDWYRDSNAVEVEPCLSSSDPMCNGPLPAPNPDAEVSFPDNFPDEFFYFTGEASLTANGGNNVLALYTIEGTYGGGNTQTVFGRTRYRIRGGITPGAQYKVTGPYGVDTLVAGDDGTIFVTEDVGVGSGNFGGLFEGQVGPFLKWDTEKPAGYLGDPTVPHTVTGSPFEQNFVKIEGPGIGGAGNPNPCPGATDGSPDCIYTNLFSILGKESTRGGVEVARATYSLDSATGAKPQIDVMAESKGDQDIVVQDTIVGAGRRFQVTPLEMDKARYFAHLNVQGDLPKTVNVVNRKDTPQTVKEVPVVDHLTGTALYNADTDNLHVQAASSDKTKPLTDLSVSGVGPIANMDASGAVDIHTIAPTATVKVSAKLGGGSVVIPVVVQGNGLPALPLAANAGGDQTVEQGVTVELDGTASTGNIDGYKWTSSDPSITLTGANSPKATFTAPSAAGDYTFTLEVTGPDGPNGTTTTTSASVVVHVNEVSNARARIAFGGDVVATNLAPGALTVPQNLPLTLDAGQSAGAATFTWSQVSGPPVDLGPTNQAKLTFTFPKTGTPIKLQVQARQPGAPSGSCVADACTTATITLNPELDDVQITTARFVTNGTRWRVDGTASSTNRNRVQVYSGLAIDPARRIGTADVLADHSWSVDARDSVIPVTTCQCVTVVSDRGGQVVDFKLEKPQNLPPTTEDPGTPPAPIVTAAAARAGGPTALAAVPLAGATTLRVTRVATPAAVTAASVGTTGVPVTLSVPTGANLVRLRVLTTANKALFSTFKKVKGGTKVKMSIKSAKLRKQLRAGKRYVIEVRAGTARNHLGKATRKVVRIRA
jgi:hypothetical protein